ncbi:hypothetical protein ACLKA6_012971 [Drosophila palustris]
MQLNLGRLFWLPLLLLSLGLAQSEASPRTPILDTRPHPSPYNPNPPRGGPVGRDFTQCHCSCFKRYCQDAAL